MIHPFYSANIPNEGTLHSFENEKDACGVGFVAHIKGKPSHAVLEKGLQCVCRMVHRGAAVEADKKTGDGAGVMTQIPRKFFARILAEMGVELPDINDLGVGMFFLPTNETSQFKVRLIVESLLDKRGLRFLGWRDVPVRKKELGEKARQTMPEITQLLVARPEGMDDDTFERQLFLVRRELRLKASQEKLQGCYVASLSHRTLVYKALVIATVLPKFYEDLVDEDYETAIALYHQRFSTNTFPTWPLGHPFRFLAHNGEINTLRGNRNWMASREADFDSPVWGKDAYLLKSLIDPNGSDSASLDAALELLVLSGRSLAHAMSILVPPAWQFDTTASPEMQAYFQYHAGLSEPWDGPAGLVFTDGRTVCAGLDRNGLRPSRYKITDDDLFILGSEVGVGDIDDATVIKKGRLAPGEIIEIDTLKGAVRYNCEVKEALAARQPYGQWLKDKRLSIHTSEPPAPPEDVDVMTLSQRQVAFGWNQEELDFTVSAMIGKAEEATYSMGDDIPLAVLSLQPRLLYTYFRQLFAQVTNPPIDPIRERAVMSLDCLLGKQRNILGETPDHARFVHLGTPFLFENELEALKNLPDFPARTLDITWPQQEGAAGLEKAIKRICYEAEAAANDHCHILILSDRATDHARVAVPALMAVGAVHHHLKQEQKRTQLSIVVETAEARDTHQMACLFGYGATVVCPYLAFETIHEMIERDRVSKKPVMADMDYATALKNYRKALEKGVLKIMSKMGISALASYRGAQIFEAVGLGKDLINACFVGTSSQIGGIGFQEIAEESLRRHTAGFGVAVPDASSMPLGDPGYNRWRRDGEIHAINGPVIKNFHTFVRDEGADPLKYEAYVQAQLLNTPVALKDMMEFVPSEDGPIPIEKVESITSIRRRFTTAAMSLGALSPEAHETLAVAMNRIGGKSDSGEGGEDPRRFRRQENGDWSNSAIKQVASGRFGVTAEYLSYAEELEIKMAQGAKPGEGGQLPAHKVNRLIAKLRNTQPGVTLISPPPHHDIYSIEDLAQLINDLKQVNPRARVCVKLVAEAGVGTVAAGVAKASADIILISGHDGGTGASPLSSIKHAGLPWELGLAEAQQVLLLNGLRERVTLRTDGGLRNGRDIVIAAILGAEEYNFGTTALIAMGCVYVRQCHLNNCPVGIATTDPKFRSKFKGKPEHVVAYFNAVAEEVRGIMAQLGVARLDDLIGRTEFLRQREVPGHPKANMLDLSVLLKDVAKNKGEDIPRHCLVDRNDGIQDHPLDDEILFRAHDTLRHGTPTTLHFEVGNTMRNIGTKLSGEIAYNKGNHGLPDDSIRLNLTGSAGQSFGTFLCGGIKMMLTGEANDYVGKGMCGGEIIIKPRPDAKFNSWENSIVGNTVLYGATGGYLYVAGRAGERFCVRNSGGTAVVEGVGDHCCEYMTMGTVVVLGDFGKNFGAGMSGGFAYVYDPEQKFARFYNSDMIRFEPLTDPDGMAHLKDLVAKHAEKTGSKRSAELLVNWDQAMASFIKVIPKVEPVVIPPEEEVPQLQPIPQAVLTT